MIHGSPSVMEQQAHSVHAMAVSRLLLGCDRHLPRYSLHWIGRLQQLAGEPVDRAIVSNRLLELKECFPAHPLTAAHRRTPPMQSSHFSPVFCVPSSPQLSAGFSGAIIEHPYARQHFQDAQKHLVASQHHSADTNATQLFERYLRGDHTPFHFGTQQQPAYLAPPQMHDALSLPHLFDSATPPTPFSLPMQPHQPLEHQPASALNTYNALEQAFKPSYAPSALAVPPATESDVVHSPDLRERDDPEYVPGASRQSRKPPAPKAQSPSKEVEKRVRRTWPSQFEEEVLEADESVNFTNIMSLGVSSCSFRC